MRPSRFPYATSPDNINMMIEMLKKEYGTAKK